MPDDNDQLAQHPTAAAASGSVVGWIRAGFLDAELAALLWLLLDGRVPVIVASGEDGARRAGRVAALMTLLGQGQATVRIGEAADVAGLPEATELGWLSEVGPGAVAPRAGGDAVSGGGSGPSPIPREAVLIADDLGSGLGRRWRAATRVLVRAVTRGFGLVSSVSAASLEEVFSSLRSMQVGLREDELSYLGVVLVAGRDGVATVAGDEGAAAAERTEAPTRIAVAHYVRPVARDAHGHVQRLGPAVLASRSAAPGEWEHFAWGIYPELAARVGSRAGDFEHEHVHRTQYLAGLAAAGVTDSAGVRSALERYRHETALGRRR